MVIDAYYCIGEVIIPDNVVAIAEGAFSECKKVTSIVIPEGVTILKDTFRNCKSIRTVKLPSHLRIIEDFYECDALESIVIPEGVEELSSESFINVKI